MVGIHSLRINFVLFCRGKCFALRDGFDPSFFDFSEVDMPDAR